MGALVGFRVAGSTNFLTTFRDNLPVPYSRVKNLVGTLTLRTGRLDCPETSARNYHYPLCYNPEERPSSRVKNRKLGPMGCPETSGRNCHYSLCYKPEERSSHLLRGGIVE